VSVWLRKQILTQRIQEAKVVSVTTDAWSSKNHRSYIAVAGHFERKGAPYRVLLDVVEVPRSHTGETLALEMAKVLEEFGIEKKVSKT
jgi:hypothetical protein